MREGLLIVLSGPSGTGKGTLVKEIIKSRDGIKLSVSATTRKPRKGEIDGESYFFVSTERFCGLVGKDELIEWVEYCGNLYGTPEKFVIDSIHNGIDVIFELEVEGAERILSKFPQCVMIFVVPPSFKELRKRIEKRGTEDTNAIEKRLERAREEMEYINNYEYIVVNDKVKDAVEGINSIINAEKLKINRNSDLINKLGMGGVS
ncbi:MAG: guanylate kinase [Eubacteriales bacterium]|nr:guanylate kinase [Eubacteriales bacterium]